tara:strand:+ start:1007 stop:1342 length:336 start_codon:yes stop_codon:yes gene_type:complete
MIVKKITTGFVIQTFATEQGVFVRQEFVAGDECDYEDEDGSPLETIDAFKDTKGKEAYLPFEMVQPGGPNPDLPYDWQCPICMYEVKWTMNQVADGGTPICPECDCDMKLA